jgi:nicotinate-nucleotide pyrophosphorylase (carboxylating)
LSDRSTDLYETPMHDYKQVIWNDAIQARAELLARLALQEDLNGEQDWTTTSLVPEQARGAAKIVTRKPGVVAGMPLVEMVCRLVDPALKVEITADEGTRIAAGDMLARLSGPARSLLIAERTVLNFLGRLCGIATLTFDYVQAISGTHAHIYDTRKTTPGWRLLEKYAVHCGGGRNHRMALNEAVLIKDNHLAFGAAAHDKAHFTPAEAVQHARNYVRAQLSPQRFEEFIFEIEVDSLDQLRAVLPAQPSIVLLDNMTPDLLRQAVVIRNETAPAVELEASGGVNLGTVRAIAETGVERISSGALTHSAVVLDVGLDWE